MEALRVPTVSIQVELYRCDGAVSAGRVFAPAAAASHAGAMRPLEWLNDGAAFAPFLPDGAPRAVLLAKEALAVLTVAAELQPYDVEADGHLHPARVEVTGGRVCAGQVAFELPRLLDLLNRPERFFAVRDGERVHLVNKRHVTLVSEPPEE
jgi:hypothetical protein